MCSIETKPRGVSRGVFSWRNPQCLMVSGRAYLRALFRMRKSACVHLQAFLA